MISKAMIGIVLIYFGVVVTYFFGKLGCVHIDEYSNLADKVLMFLFLCAVTLLIHTMGY